VSRLAHMHREASQEEGKAMKVVILGVGALGSLTGAHLAQAGEEILFIAVASVPALGRDTCT
jgi:molybdopterin/thiamine biosynthesis adenylyltransferase